MAENPNPSLTTAKDPIAPSVNISTSNTGSADNSVVRADGKSKVKDRSNPNFLLVAVQLFCPFAFTLTNYSDSEEKLTRR